MRQQLVKTVLQAQDVCRGWREGLAVAAGDAVLKRLIVDRKQELLPRFAAHYIKLKNLPRRARRRLQRRLKQSLAAIALLLALGAMHPAMALSLGNIGSLIARALESDQDSVSPPSSEASICRAARAVNEEIGGQPSLQCGQPQVAEQQRARRLVEVVQTPNGRARLLAVPPGQEPTPGRARMLVPAATIIVGGNCTLSEAITSCNTDTAVGGCTAGSGADTILLQPQSRARMPATPISHPQYGRARMPVIASPIIIDANGSSMVRARRAAAARIFTVAPGGDLWLEEIAIIGGEAAEIPGVPLSGDGGGILNVGGNVILIDSIVSGNTADDEGGGIYSRNSNLYAANSTISSNSAATGGGVSGYGGELDLTRTLISGNEAPNGAEAYVDSASGAIVTVDEFNLFGHDGEAGVEGFSLGSTDVLPAEPLTEIIDPDTGEPAPESPALDAVSGGACVTETSDENPICNIGSSEPVIGSVLPPDPLPPLTEEPALPEPSAPPMPEEESRPTEAPPSIATPAEA